MRYLVVGRHRFTDRQLRLLEKAGLTEEVKRIATVEDPVDVVLQAVELGVDAIVVQSLPMELLARLVDAADSEFIPVYTFKIEAIATASNMEEAEEIARREKADIILPDPRSGNIRVSKTVALQRVLRIVVETREVATLP